MRLTASSATAFLLYQRQDCKAGKPLNASQKLHFASKANKAPLLRPLKYSALTLSSIALALGFCPPLRTAVQTLLHGPAEQSESAPKKEQKKAPEKPQEPFQLKRCEKIIYPSREVTRIDWETGNLITEKKEHRYQVCKTPLDA